MSTIILHHMTKYSSALDNAFAALSDPTRRAIIARLCESPASVGELAEPFDLALPTLLKHVQVLEKSGLVSSEKSGRVRTCRVEARALRETEDWLRHHIAAWEQRLDRMEAHIMKKKKEN